MLDQPLTFIAILILITSEDSPTLTDEGITMSVQSLLHIHVPITN